MKTLGLIGGMSWESTALYYTAINRAIGTRLGALHSAKVVVSSVDFQEIVELQRADKWDEAGNLLAHEALRLKAAGVDYLALAVNTMHKVVPAIRSACDLPLIDIRSAVAEQIGSRRLRRVALLSTRYVVEQGFYGEQIAAEARCEIVRPEPTDRSFIHAAIYDELTKGLVSRNTREQVAGILRKLQSDGADGAILACTELPMLDLQPLVPGLPLVDSTAVHTTACVDAMLG